MRTPTFFLIGAAKAATTSLASLLQGHPEAAIVRGKEPHFFSYDHHYRLGWPSYLKLYDHCRDERAIGDASTSYSRLRYHPAVPERIQRHVPEARILYMVRHPLQRMESAYVEHLCTPGRPVYASFTEALQRQPMILDSSRYWEVFDAYRQRFGDASVKVVWFEDYAADTPAVFQEVCRFLGIDDAVLPDLTREDTNPREDAAARLAQLGRTGAALDTTWEPTLRRAVLDQLRADNLRLLAHFGKPRDYWGELF